MSSMNKATIMGNLGRDPEIKSTPSGTKIASFSIATSEKWKDKGTGDAKEATEWHRIVAFQTGERGLVTNVIQPYLKKGDSVLVEGQIRTRKWKGKDDDIRYSTEIVLSGPKATLLLMGKSKGGSAATQPSEPSSQDADMSEDIPFN